MNYEKISKFYMITNQIKLIFFNENLSQIIFSITILICCNSTMIGV